MEFPVSGVETPFWLPPLVALVIALFTSVAGLGFYQLLALHDTGQSVAPNWLLGLYLGVGGFVGMYLGARCQRHVPGHAIEFLLGGCTLFVGLRYVAGFFST